MTSGGFTVASVSGSGYGGVQYACVSGANASAPTEESAWGTSTSFSSLSPASPYTVFARYGGDQYYEPSAASSGLVVYTAAATPGEGVGFSVNYAAETASAAEDYEISVDGMNWLTDSIDVKPGSTLYVRVAAVENGAPASDVCENVLPARPAAPVLTSTGETLEGENDGALTIGNYASDTTYEISSDNGASWSDAMVSGGGVISGLADGDYLVRVKATDTSFASNAAPATIAAGEVRTYTLSVTAQTFDDATYGYDAPAAKPLTIVSSGNSKATISSVTLRGDGASAFSLNRTDGTEVPAGATDSTTYTVAPVAGLDAGTYQAEVVVAYDNGAEATASVSFTVTPAAQAAPEGVSATSERTAGGSNGALTGLPAGSEWRAAGGAWAAAPASGTVEGLAPGSYEVRMAADRNHEASESVTLAVESFSSAHGGITYPDGTSDDGSGNAVLPEGGGTVTWPGGQTATLPGGTAVDPEAGMATTPGGSAVAPAEDGSLTVTFPDGSTATVPGGSAFGDASVTLPDGTTVAPGEGGALTVTLPDGTALTAPSGSTVAADGSVTAPDGSPVEPPQAEEPPAPEEPGAEPEAAPEPDDGLAKTGDPTSPAAPLVAVAGVAALLAVRALRRQG
ncbi:hypothetical protein [Thermophilibacter sp.]